MNEVDLESKNVFRLRGAIELLVSIARLICPVRKPFRWVDKMLCWRVDAGWLSPSVYNLIFRHAHGWAYAFD
jgi:hypothetical protein